MPMLRPMWVACVRCCVALIYIYIRNEAENGNMSCYCQSTTLGLVCLLTLSNPSLPEQTVSSTLCQIAPPANCRVAINKATPNTVPLDISTVGLTEGRVTPSVVPRPATSTSPGIVRNADSQALTQAYWIRSSGPSWVVTHVSVGQTSLKSENSWVGASCSHHL